jgi:predicted acylesterase/phospholipase RssA
LSGLKVGTINSIQQYYKLPSPFYFKKKNYIKKKGSQAQKEKTEQSLEQSFEPPNSKKKIERK